MNNQEPIDLADQIAKDGEMIMQWGEEIDDKRLKIGFLVAERRMKKSYGDDTVGALAKASKMAKSGLHAYANVALFVTDLCNIESDGWKKSTPVDFLIANPHLGYTHLRAALPRPTKHWEFEDACDAIRAVIHGDNSKGFEEFNKSLPMTATSFQYYCDKKMKANNPSNNNEADEIEVTELTETDYDDSDAMPIWDSLWDILDTSLPEGTAIGTDITVKKEYAHNALNGLMSRLKIADDTQLRIIVYIDEEAGQ